jgi:hypothetical protein
MTLALLWAMLVTAAVAANGQSAPKQKPQAGMLATQGSMCARCPMCNGQMSAQRNGPHGSQGMGMMGGMMGMQGMGGMRSTPGAAITVTPDGTIYVLDNGVLHKYSPDLKLLGSAPLPHPAPTDESHAGHH